MRRWLLATAISSLIACGDKDGTGPGASDSGLPPGDDTGFDADGDGVGADEDCDDTDASVFPGNPESCDGVDQDCDDAIDEQAEDGTPYLPDADGDGYGTDEGGERFCDDPGAGYVEGGDEPALDCDDGDASVNPGATEICEDGIDNDCLGWSGECGPLGELSTFATLTGRSGGDETGNAVAGIGDADGDGLDEVVVGAWHRGGDAPKAGAAYVLFGASLAKGGEISADKADITYFGAGENDNLGYAVGPAGDFNGDGRADLIVGAWQASDGGDSSGAAFIFFGPLTAQDREDAEVQLAGAAAGDQAGAAVWTAGDVNDDGYDDLLVGAPGFSEGGDNAGAAYLMLGPTGFSSVTSATQRWYGETGAKVGSAVRGAGDVDGDGTDDVLVGAPGDGAAYLVPDPTKFSGTLGEGTNQLYLGRGQAGAALAGGDVNGDGYADVLIGAPNLSDSATNEGGAWLLHGPITGDLELEEAAVASFLAGQEGSELGASVEVIEGMYSPTGGAVALGIPGLGDKGAVMTFNNPQGAIDVTKGVVGFVAGDDGDGLGSGLGAADVDGDGYLDLLAGAIYADNSAGAAYVFLGGGD